MYTLELTRQCAKELRRIQHGNPRIYATLVDVLENLQTNPYPPGSKELTGRAGRRLRVGQYRILYTVVEERLLVQVLRTGPRGDVYK